MEVLLNHKHYAFVLVAQEKYNSHFSQLVMGISMHMQVSTMDNSNGYMRMLRILIK